MAAIDFPANPNNGQQFSASGVTWTFDGVKWTALGNNLGIPDAPADSQLYGRKNGSWALASGGGGGISDAPSDGTSYSRKNGGWVHLSHTDITDWTATLAPYALVTSVPAAGSSLPVINGTAAAGASSAFSRQDHVHPTDTSRYSASNPAGYIPDAPSDNTNYARKNAAWVGIPSGGLSDAPVDGSAYSRQDGYWVNNPTLYGITVDGSSGGNTDSSNINLMITPPANDAGLIWYNSSNLSWMLMADKNNNLNLSYVTDYPVIMNGPAKTITYAWPVTLAGAPTLPLHAATKTYVDGVGGAKLNLSGGTLTGPLILAADPTAALGAATKQYADNAGPNANRIINGEFIISQRGLTFSPTGGVYTLDRWAWSQTLGTNRGTMDRVTAPTGGASIAAGISYYFRWTSVASAYTIVAGDNFSLQQRIEGVNCTDLAWGTASAQPVTVSFWVNTSVAGNYGGSIRAADNTRSYPFQYNVAAASTWEKKTITIPGDTGGAWGPTGQNNFLTLTLDLGAGATYRSTAGTWQAGNFTGVTGTQSPAAGNATAWYFAKVKLELGPVATPWVFQPYSKTLADCQRYFQVIQNAVVCTGYNTAGALVHTPLLLPAQMRALPSVTYTSQAYGNASALSLNQATITSVLNQMSITAVGYGYASAIVTLDAEL